MSFDMTERVFNTFVPKADASLYIGSTFKVMIVALIKGNPHPPKNFTFNVYVTDSPASGCPGYYYIKAPRINDVVVSNGKTY
jgi:hypothetical protein